MDWTAYALETQCEVSHDRSASANASTDCSLAHRDINCLRTRVNGLEHLVGCAVRGTVGPVQNKGASVPSKFSSPTGPRRFSQS
jgi:hypothetical protein